MFRQECEQFDKMVIHKKFIYILTYEGPLMNHVAKFVHEILSVKKMYLCDACTQRCGIVMYGNHLEEYTIMHI